MIKRLQVALTQSQVDLDEGRKRADEDVSTNWQTPCVADFGDTLSSRQRTQYDFLIRVHFKNNFDFSWSHLQLPVSGNKPRYKRSFQPVVLVELCFKEVKKKKKKETPRIRFDFLTNIGLWLCNEISVRL